ncbi:hypothetical protein LOK49_LG07G01030 [Camellia lanceoleosa]|uniref:Uncharacterized protein n=1 Tax=Camellia lanceoleosa TaxID=1840588 RepID=A0ACC0H8H6_9ERIC|nr:hypothetical protein LOK49_LG07G01030 [Camellia lanceoleosa]
MCTKYHQERKELVQALHKDIKLSDLLKITQPMLIISGNQDQIFPLELVHRLKRYWKMEKLLFRKKLSPSDVRTCLEIPRRIALNLPKYEVEGSNGKAEMVMRVRDQTGRNWRFRRGSRRDGRDEVELGLECLHQSTKKELQVHLNVDGPLKDSNEFHTKLARLARYF